MLPEEIQRDLLTCLQQINPVKIILFGSYADGTAGPDSDIDLLVVTDDPFLPKNFSEKNAIYLRVANTIVDIEKKTPIDLIVHTRAMHKKFIQLDGMFAKQITSKGKVLYERAD